MKFKAILFASVILSKYSYCQENMGFQHAIIITTRQDTIPCWVPIASSFGDRVDIRKTIDNEGGFILLENIQFLITDFNVYQHITYMKEDTEFNKLMWLEIEGKPNLYLEVKASKTGTAHKEQFGTVTKLDPPVKTYVIKKDDKTWLVENEAGFAKTIKHLIADVPELVAKVDANQYHYMNIEELIKEYNRMSASK